MNTEQYTVIIDIAISRNCRIVFVSRTDKTKRWLMQCERTRDVITETPWLALCLISDPIPPPPPQTLRLSHPTVSVSVWWWWLSILKKFEIKKILFLLHNVLVRRWEESDEERNWINEVNMKLAHTYTHNAARDKYTKWTDIHICEQK